MVDGSEKQKDKINTEGSVSHKNTSDLVNSALTYDQRFVNRYVKANVSTNLFGIRLSNNHGDFLSFNSGIQTNWELDKPYQHALRNRSISILSASKTFELNNGYKINFREASSYIATDGKGPTISFFHQEAKIIHKDYALGIGGIAGKNQTENQLYAFGEYKGLRVNAGAYDIKNHAANFRGMVSYDLKINKNNNLQFFTSIESGENGGERVGVLYRAKIKKVSFGSDVILNSNSPHHIENINARADFPFKFNEKDKHSLGGVIGVFGGFSGGQNGVDKVYGVSLKADLFNSKNHKHNKGQLLIL